MVSQDLVERASKRLGHRPELVATPVEIIAHRMGEGQSVRRIARYLQSLLGPDNSAASPEFVRWVIGQLRRGEADRVRGGVGRGGAW